MISSLFPLLVTISTKYIRLHPFTIKDLLLVKIADIELSPEGFPSTCNFEHEPREVAFSVGIDPHEQVIFLVSRLAHHVQISILEIRVKMDIVRHHIGVHSSKESLGILLYFVRLE